MENGLLSIPVPLILARLGVMAANVGMEGGRREKKREAHRTRRVKKDQPGPFCL